MQCYFILLNTSFRYYVFCFLHSTPGCYDNINKLKTSVAISAMYCSTRSRLLFSCSLFLSGIGKLFLNQYCFSFGKKKKKNKARENEVFKSLTSYRVYTPSYKYATISTPHIFCRKNQMMVEFSLC